MHLILYTKPGCHLCERLEQLLASQTKAHELTVQKRDIQTNPAYTELYRHRIPVLTTLDGRVVIEGNPDAQQVQMAVHALLRSA